MKRLIMGLLCFILAFSLVFSVYGQDEVVIPIEEVPYEFSLDLQCFKPVKITFNYPYTNKHSITDISTVGQSLYKHEGSATYLTFIAEDIDIYTFTVRLFYENVTANTTRIVLIGLWSGTMPMDGYTIRSTCGVFVFHVRLSVTEQPSYPTEEEVAKEVVHQIEQSLVQQTEENRRLLSEIQVAVTTTSLMALVASVTSVIALVFAGYAYRRRRMIAE